ncbi:imidazole glycerol phosphate synthase subunit HisF [candidate division WOR-3 bacterium]|nr:imidazole glycerol phosphate synthase subunit HisF [candidate division WOR-3 bacterium]
MLATRIIPCLDVDFGRVVKGIKFKELDNVGDPVEMAKEYNEQGADELTFLDIGASYKSREILIEVVEKVSEEVFIPLTVGGGLRSSEDMRKALNSGADKVAICTSAIENPELITEGANIFGSQCIVLSIDAKKHNGSWYAYTHGGRNNSGIDAIKWAKEGEKLGAGEILLNSIDKDGTKEGYDLELTAKISEIVNIPVIASGGAGNPQQMVDAVKDGKADAVLLASLLHYGEYTIKEIKEYLEKKEICVR